MAIRLTDLTAASSRMAKSVHPEVASVTEALQKRVKTAFLSHSHLDANYAKGFVNLLREAGWNVYIDWMDTSLPSQPSRVTAQKIKSRIENTEYFLFLATPNSMASRWCPWEIGYADGKKNVDKILVVATQDANGNTHGSQYLDLYREVDFTGDKTLGVWSPGRPKEGIAIKSL